MNRLEQSTNQKGEITKYFYNGLGYRIDFQDDIGSVIQLTDAKGNVTDSYGYDEFGQDLYKNQAIVQLFGFTGYQYDRVSGNYYAQAREYEPKNGRFISEDPIRYNLNHYLYCNNNPYLFVDPSGLKNTFQ